MVFGVFDRLHEGHRAFLRQAKRYGTKLVAVVARDRAVFQLKKRKPRQNERVRVNTVRRVGEVNRAVLGDQKRGSYSVIKKFAPAIICLGYDQRMLARDLKMRMRHGAIPTVRLVRLKPYRSKKFHTSILNARKK